MLLIIAAPLVVIALTLALTRLTTSLKYYKALHRLTTHSKKEFRELQPIQIPYTIPWVGNAPFLFNRNPGQSWAGLFKWHPRDSGVLTLLVNGRSVQFVYSPTVVQAVLKSRAVAKTTFEDDFLAKAFDMPPDQIALSKVHKFTEESINANYLTSFERVCELTSEFTRILQDILDKEDKSTTTGLYQWLRSHLFEAPKVFSPLAGDTLFDVYPEWTEDFWCFENEFGNFMVDMPAFLNRTAVERRERMFSKLTQWSEQGHSLFGTPIDPQGPAWEPTFGSRLERAMQLLYRNANFTRRSGAAFDASLMFGLASNAIPVTGWMLFHILKPAGPPLLPTIMSEIRSSLRDDESVDVLKLIAQPLLQSIWTECLRLYSDVIVGRTVIEDTVFPLDEGATSYVRLSKGDQLYIPSYVLHHDPSWQANGSCAEIFDPKRFYEVDSKGEARFVFNNSAGRFLPFGGGKTICPGRIFAKQKTMAAVAIILLNFEFDALDFVDSSGLQLEFPKFRKAFIGSGALSPDGDLKVQLTKLDK